MKIKWISAVKGDLDTVSVTQTNLIDRKTISHKVSDGKSGIRPEIEFYLMTLVKL